MSGCEPSMSVMFHINLHLPKLGATDAALELSRHIRAQFAARYRRAA
jgi:hypothetical protein